MYRSERAGRRLRRWRKTAGLRLFQVAATLGITEAYLSRLERGERSPSLGLAVKILGLTSIETEAWK